MTEQQTVYIYYAALGCCALIALIRFRQSDMAVRFLCIYILYGLLTELLSVYSIRKLHNNFMAYNLYDYVSFALLSNYFYLSVSTVKSRRVVIGIIVLTLCALVLNIVYRIDFKHTHQYIFMDIGYLLLITMALYSIYRLILKDERSRIYRQPSFWIATLLVFYEFVNLWGKSSFYPFRMTFTPNNDYFHFMILVANIILYSALAYLLWQYPKMKNIEQ